MADAREELMASIRAGLEGMPGESVRQALEFYEEYLAEALEAGRSVDETLKSLGGVKEIVAQVRAEATLSRAERSPGPFRMIGAGRQVFRGIADSAARFSLIVGASIPYTLTLGFYLLAGAALLGAVVSAVLLGYGITTMPGAFIREKIGVAGAAVFIAAFLTALGLALWRIANGISRITLRVLRKGLWRDQRPGTRAESGRPRTGRARMAFLICGVAGLLGIGAMAFSSLPMKLFSIWNSQKPASLAVRTWSYSTSEIREIEVATLNSSIVLEAAARPADGIRVTYEEPDWLTGEPVVSNTKLTFRETSSGMVPFMDLISGHPGMTSVRIEMPPGYLARSVTFTSRSGSVSLAFPAESIRAKTYSGSIRFVAGRAPYRIRASAPDGKILVQGKVQEGNSYEAGVGGNTAELSSAKGTVEIQ
jgi:uncharacterized membrane protein